MNILKANTKAEKTVYAVIAILVAIFFPLFLLKNSNTGIKINTIGILLLLFYSVGVVGLVLLIFRIENFRLKLLKIDNEHLRGSEKFNLFLIALVVISMVYNLVNIIIKLW